MNDDENFIYKYYAQSLPSNNNSDVYSGSKYDTTKQIVRCNKRIILDLLLNKSNSFEWQVSLLFFVINDKKISSHMAHISEHINSSNRKIHSYDQMGEITVNLSNNR